jgi:hypothetical protein
VQHKSVAGRGAEFSVATTACIGSLHHLRLWRDIFGVAGRLGSQTCQVRAGPGTNQQGPVVGFFSVKLPNVYSVAPQNPTVRLLVSHCSWLGVGRGTIALAAHGMAWTSSPAIQSVTPLCVIGWPRSNRLDGDAYGCYTAPAGRRGSRVFSQQIEAVRTVHDTERALCESN